MADNYTVLDGLKASLTFAAKEIGGVLFPKKIVVDGTGAEVAFTALLQALAPASGAIAVTPDDATTLTNVRAIYVGTGGDVVATIGGADFTFANVPDGTTLPIKATKIKATGTTASGIVALT